MAAFASTDDLTEQWRALSTDELFTATALLDRVSSLIRTRMPTIDARILSEPHLASLTSGVAVDAVLRVMRNPEGLVQESVGGYSYSRAAGTVGGGLYVSDDEWALLMPATLQGGRAFTVRPGVRA